MTRAQKRKIAMIVALVIMLALLGAYYAYYKATHQLKFNLTPASTVNAIQPPQFLYAFSGSSIKLQRPIGVYVDVDSDSVYVPDAMGRQILVFNQAGDFKRSFGTSVTVIPLNIVKNPKTNELLVSDRRLRKLLRFDVSGKFLGEFDPHLPKDQLPKFKTFGVQWEPVAMAFAPDGTLYVTEILKGHRFLIFNPDGTFKKSIGDAGIVNDAKLAPGSFQFPNGIVYHNGLVYITDSNNRRVQVYDKDGNYQKIIVTQGLPRGIDFLNRFPGDTAKTSDRFVVIDTLSHDGTIWSTTGDKILNFGTQGVLDGQFQYPNGCSVGSKNKIFIADTANGRIQVWGWPDQVSPVPIPRVPNNWWLCLPLLLIIPLLIFSRRKRFFATEDFVLAMVEAEQTDLMRSRRRKWLVTQEDYDKLKDMVEGGIELGKLLHPTEYSESDARALAEKLEVDMPTAIIMAISQRNPVFCTEDANYRKLAKSLDVDVVDRPEFLDRFERRRAKNDDTTGQTDQP